MHFEQPKYALNALVHFTNDRAGESQITHRIATIKCIPLNLNPFSFKEMYSLIKSSRNILGQAGLLYP